MKKLNVFLILALVLSLCLIPVFADVQTGIPARISGIKTFVSGVIIKDLNTIILGNDGKITAKSHKTGGLDTINGAVVVSDANTIVTTKRVTSGWGVVTCGTAHTRFWTDPNGTLAFDANTANTSAVKDANSCLNVYTDANKVVCFQNKLGASYPIKYSVNFMGDFYDFILKWGSSGSGDGQFYAPYSVTTNTLGDVFVVDLGNSRIQKFNSVGTYITKWGSSGSGNGQFNEPYSVATNTLGDVFVVDKNNSRIQKFNQP